MWELDYKESWAPKNWCFWTVVLEKTLESPSDCKEIKPVHPKGNQSWIFTGKTDAKLKLQYFGHLMRRTDSFGKDPDAEKDWRQEEKGTTEGELVGRHHHLPKFTQTHAHRVGNAIQSSHPLSSPSLPAFNLSQNQVLSQWINTSHQLPKVLELQLEYQSFKWIFRIDFSLGLTSLISLMSKGLSSTFSSTTVQKHIFFSAQPSLWSNSYIPTLLREKQ